MTYKATSYTHNGRSYPAWCGNEPKQRTIFRFLSTTGDHYNKSIAQIKKAFGIYRIKLAKIPVEYIQEHLGIFIADNMGLNKGVNQDYRFSPSPALIYEFLRSRPEFNKRWEVTDFGAFCMNCRSSEDAKEGGFRQIYIRYIDEHKIRHIREYIGTCDCKATKDASNIKGSLYTTIITHYERKYNDVECFYSYYCSDTERPVTSKEQSSEVWECRLKGGYVFENDNGYYPNWEHSFWRSNVGLALSAHLNWEMPEGMQKEIEIEMKRQKSGNGVLQRWNTQARSRKDGKVQAPRSISSLL
tara:strand:+ start:175 stop:1074 length:900 start_codon:yes stop_codon:yes gene_type:complete